VASVKDLPSAARVPERVSVPSARLWPVTVVMSLEFVEPETAIGVVGGTQAEVESEWRMPVRAADVPENDPESAGSLTAALADEEICQLPVTLTGTALGVALLPQPAKRRVEVRRRAAQKLEWDERAKDMKVLRGPIGDVLRGSMRCGGRVRIDGA
jgi:hypothetical protein